MICVTVRHKKAIYDFSNIITIDSEATNKCVYQRRIKVGEILNKQKELPQTDYILIEENADDLLF